MPDLSRPRRVRVEAFFDAGECLVYSATRDEASALNRTATEVWTLCDGRREVPAIARELAGRYGVDAALLLDEVRNVVGDLHARGLVEVGPD